MKSKFKTVGLAVAVAMVSSALTTSGASATFNGHFTSDVEHTTIIGSEKVSTGHFLQFRSSAGSTPIICFEGFYEGTINAPTKTTQFAQVSPSYTQCRTDGGVAGSVVIHPNGCTYTLLSRTPPATATVAVDCPTGKVIEITHPNCVIKVPAQFGTASILTGGVTFEKIEENGKPALTLYVGVNQVTTHYESGICVFLGTKQSFELTGSMTVIGRDKFGAAVGIAAT